MIQIESRKTEKDLRRYSISRALLASANRNWSEADFEYEVSKTIAKELGLETNGFFVPQNVLAAAALRKAPYQRAVLGTGGDQFANILKEKALVVSLGSTVFSDVQDDLAFSSSMKTVVVTSEYSRQLLANSNASVDALVADDFFSDLGQKIDQICFFGNGIDQPKGILNQSGIGIVPIGPNGGKVNFDHFAALERAVPVANSNGNTCAY